MQSVHVCVCVRSVRLKDITSTMRSGICVRGVTVRDEVGGKGKVCDLYLRWGLHDQGMFTSNNGGTHVHGDLLFEPRLCEPPLFLHLATTKKYNG